MTSVLIPSRGFARRSFLAATRRWRIGALLGLLLWSSAPSVFGAPSVDEVAALIERYGAAALVEVLMEARGGELTLEVQGQLVERFGRPNPDYVNARTLAQDMEKAGLDVASIEKTLGKAQDARAAQEKRWAESDSASADIPLGGFDPKFRIRGHRRTWTVEKLIADADQEPNGWPEWLVVERKQLAYQRNRALQDIFANFEATYGTTDISEIKAVIRSEYDARRTECRRIKRNRALYKKRGCLRLSRGTFTRAAREIDNAVRAPFRAFDKALSSHVRRFKTEQKSTIVY